MKKQLTPRYFMQTGRTVFPEVEDVVFVGDSLVDDVAEPQKLAIDTILVDRKNKYDSSEEIKYLHHEDNYPAWCFSMESYTSKV